VFDAAKYIIVIKMQGITLLDAGARIGFQA
jgi:hypothetical protein